MGTASVPRDSSSAAGDIVTRLGKIDTCAVSDALDRLNLEGAVIGIKPQWPGPKVAGRVTTVKLVEADGRKSTRHLGTAAVDSAGPGRVIVIDHAGREKPAGWGGILSLAAKVKGVEGVICDGAVRDIDESREMGFPVYARSSVSITARGRVIEESFNEPIQIVGIPVNPDDFVLADGSGVTFIPAARAEEVVSTAEMIAAREAEMARDVRAGKSVIEVMGANYEAMTGRH